MTASRTLVPILYWTPRVLCLLFTLFLSMFALDVFKEGKNLIDTLLAFFMHLTPALLVLLVLALAWRYELLGGIALIVLGILYVVTAWGRFPLSVYFVIAGPLILVGSLFLASWLVRRPDPPGGNPSSAGVDHKLLKLLAGS